MWLKCLPKFERGKVPILLCAHGLNFFLLNGIELQNQTSNSKIKIFRSYNKFWYDIENDKFIPIINLIFLYFNFLFFKKYVYNWKIFFQEFHYYNIFYSFWLANFEYIKITLFVEALINVIIYLYIYI